jgi:hypothetical protein
MSQDPSLPQCQSRQPQSPRRWTATPCNRREPALYSPSMASPLNRMNGSLHQPRGPPFSAWRNQSVCVSIAAAIVAEPSTDPTRCACNVSTNGARSAPAFPRRKRPRRSKPRKRAWSSQSERGCSLSGLGAETNSSTRPQDNASGVPVTCARNYSFPQRRMSAINASMSDAPNVRASRPSSANGRMVIQAMPSLTARPRWRNNWRSSGGHGESRGLGCDGSARSAMASFTIIRHSVLGAGTRDATSVQDHREYIFRKAINITSLTCHSVRKAEKGDHFDSQVVAAVEAKLRAMDVDDDSPSSAAEAT